ncbi:MAG: hypothetical protein QOK40_3134, partial [Miltoncostaeaceae bacterium]|nr:hypothetical protein [Miltoncostaeaceae bacterium]
MVGRYSRGRLVGLRQIALVVLVLALTIVGFVGARVLGERDVQRDSAHRAEIAATALQSDLRHAAGLLEGLRRFMVANVAVTTKQFADLGPNVLSADDLGAAAWVQRVPASSRAEYERRVGHRIVAATPSGALAPAGRRPWYLPATLVTGYPPVTVPGVDLAGEPGVAAAVARQQTLFRATSTPLARMPEGPVGLFLVESAQRFTRGGLEPGFLVLFVPDSWLLAAAAQPGGPNARLQLMIGGTSAGDLGGGATARSAFTALGQRFQVLVPRGSVDGAAALSPWVILGVGLVLAALTAALGVNAARRARAQRDLDRVFTVSPDLIAVAGFDGYFKRVNPAFEHILGYAAEELLARPFIEFVHPDDREATSAAAEALQRGETLVSFENRYVCKDGSYRWIEWASTPGLEERLIYAVARDITDRRRAEAEEAALRRMATIVARGVRPAEVFDAVAA